MLKIVSSYLDLDNEILTIAKIMTGNHNLITNSESKYIFRKFLRAIW